MEKLGNITLYNADCLEVLKSLPDNAFDIAICDPPYGIGESWKKDTKSNFYKHNTSYKNNSITNKIYFDELFRVSKNQIICGANYYTDYLFPTNAWIVWDKCRNADKTFNSECELFWTSFKKVARIAKFQWSGAVTCEKRCGFHPHEKPIKLYRWLLNNYAKNGDKILDTHLGSGSICIAAYDLGFELTGIEIDEQYYNDAKKRLVEHQRQLKIFE